MGSHLQADANGAIPRSSSAVAATPPVDCEDERDVE